MPESEDAEVNAWRLVAPSAESDPEAMAALLGWARRQGARCAPASAWMGEIARAHPELVGAIADAYGLGLLDRREATLRTERRRSTPIVVIENAVVVFLAGAPDAEVLDEVLPRWLQLGIGRRARRAIVDVSATEPLDELLGRTLLGVTELGVPRELELVVSGADPDLAWSRALAQGGLLVVHTLDQALLR